MNSKNRTYHKSNSFLRHMINVIAGFLSGILILCTGLIVVSNLRQLYYLNIEWLNIPDNLGLDTATVKHVFQDISDYLLPFNSTSINTPGIEFTSNFLNVFSDIKFLTLIIYISLVILSVLLLVSLIILLYTKKYTVLRSIAIGTFVVPTLFCIVASLFYTDIFHAIHLFFFGRTFQGTDNPSISGLFPEPFLYECLGVIFLIALIFSIIFLSIYRHFMKERDDDYLLPKKKNYYYI